MGSHASLHLVNAPTGTTVYVDVLNGFNGTDTFGKDLGPLTEGSDLLVWRINQWQFRAAIGPGDPHPTDAVDFQTIWNVLDTDVTPQPQVTGNGSFVWDFAASAPAGLEVAEAGTGATPEFTDALEDVTAVTAETVDNTHTWAYELYVRGDGLESEVVLDANVAPVGGDAGSIDAVVSPLTRVQQTPEDELDVFSTTVTIQVPHGSWPAGAGSEGLPLTVELTAPAPDDAGDEAERPTASFTTTLDHPRTLDADGDAPPADGDAPLADGDAPLADGDVSPADGDVPPAEGDVTERPAPAPDPTPAPEPEQEADAPDAVEHDCEACPDCADGECAECEDPDCPRADDTVAREDEPATTKPDDADNENDTETEEEDA
jgi:hypothetical protein